MQTKDLAMEAATCRAVASEFSGKPEQSVLLNIVLAFDELARTRRAADCPVLRSAPADHHCSKDVPAEG